MDLTPKLKTLKHPSVGYVTSVTERFRPHTKTKLIHFADEVESYWIDNSATDSRPKANVTKAQPLCQTNFTDDTYLSEDQRLARAHKYVKHGPEESIFPMPSSQLVVASATTQLTVGQLSIDTRKNQLVISQNNQSSLMSPKGAGLLVGCTRTSLLVRGNRGFLVYKETEPEAYVTQQIITSITKDKVQGKIVVEGVLGTQDDRELPYIIRFGTSENGHLRTQIEAKGLGQLGVCLERHPHETWHGMGAQVETCLNQPYRIILTREHGIDRGDNPAASAYMESIEPHSTGTPSATYSFAPVIFSRRSDSPSAKIIALRTPERTVIEQLPHHHIIRVDNTTTSSNNSAKLEFVTYLGNQPWEATQAYTNHVGRQEPPPDFVNDGYIIGFKRDFDDANELAKVLTHHQVPIASLWIENWCGSLQADATWSRVLRDWILTNRGEAGWREEARHLKEQFGLEGLLSYFSPSVSEGGFVFQKAKALGYLVKNPDGSPHLIVESDFKCGLVDLSRPEVQTWFAHKVLAPHFIKGLSLGAMVDFGENLPLKSQPAIHTNLSPEQAHQLFPEAWEAVMRLTLEEFRTKSPLSTSPLLLFRRSFTARAPAEGDPPVNDPFQVWMGDQLTSWGRNNGLASVLPYGLSLGLTKPFFHFDIGLYSTMPVKGDLGAKAKDQGLIEERDSELLMRSMELSAFMSMMRTHEGMRQGLQVWDNPQLIQHLAHCWKIFKALEPTRKRCQAEYRTTGAPLIRPMWWNTTISTEFDDQAMFGEHIVFKPVVTPSATTTTLTAPQGEWLEAFSGKVHQIVDKEGERISIATPLGTPAVLVRKNTQSARELRLLEPVAKTLPSL